MRICTVNILRAGPARGLLAIGPRPCSGDPPFDAIGWALDRATSADEIHERIGLVTDLDRDRLWHWCRATAAILAVLHYATNR